MANKIYYQEDCNLSLLEGKTIAIMGKIPDAMSLSAYMKAANQRQRQKRKD